MKKVFLFLLLTFIVNEIYCQKSSMISIEYRHFARDYHNYRRMNGYSIGFERERNINDNVSLIFGYFLDLTFEKIILYHRSIITIQDPFTLKDTTILWPVREPFKMSALGLHFPLNLKTKLFNSRIFLQAGGFITIDAIIRFKPNNRYITAFTDEQTGMEKSIRYRTVGVGYNLGISYLLSNRIEMTGALETLKSKEFTFTSAKIGLKVRISKVPPRPPLAVD